MEKTLLLATSILVISAAALWGCVFLLFSEFVAAGISFAYSAFTLAGVGSLSYGRSHRWFLYTQLLLGLIIPFVHMVVLGGFWQSGGIMLWSLISPMGALVLFGRGRALPWAVAFLTLFGLAAVIQPLVVHINNLPEGLVNLLTVMNFAAVSVITLMVLNYFINEKDEAYRLLRIEEAKSEELLLNVLPREIAATLKNDNHTIADQFESISVLFADLVGFTPLTARMPPVDVVNLLNEIFSHFDSLVERYGVEKIRTIGDSYMVAAGAPVPVPDHARRLARLALEMRDYLQSHEFAPDLHIEFRIGMNSGPAVGGVIGRKRFVYDVWGDAVNIASRMESQGVAGRIQVAQPMHDLICGEFIFEPRGVIEIKGKGQMQTWFLEGERV